MDLNQFLESIFEYDTGYIYAPYRKDGHWNKKFYHWPYDWDVFVSSLKEAKDQGDVYLSPVLYRDKEFNFLNSHVTWVDFDEGTPTELGDFPQPTFRISSSSGNKEHWYWKLDSPITDKEVLERYNRQLVHALNGDKVAWNYSRVLRPPETLNHKYDPPRAVELRKHNAHTVSELIFSLLPDPPKPKANGEEFAWVRHKTTDVLNKYSFRDSFLEFYFQPEPEHRANALTSIAITAVEIGCSRDEVMSLLDDTSNRWNKFTGRHDREERLRSIYHYAKQMVKPKEEKEDLSGPLPLSKFTAHRFSIDWIIPGLLHQRGLGIVASPPSVGKTQFSLNLSLSLGTGRNFLVWPVSSKRRVLFVSLEMTQPELKEYLDTMTQDYTDEEKQDLDNNVYFVYRPSFRLSDENNQRILLEWIDRVQPDGIVLDSLSRITSGDLEKTEVDKVFDYINKEIRDKRNKFVWIIHHNRKANFNQKQPKKLEDLYGSQFIGAYASTVIGLWKLTSTEIEVNCLKVWLSKPFNSFVAERTSNLTFKTSTRLDLK